MTCKNIFVIRCPTLLRNALRFDVDEKKVVFWQLAKRETISCSSRRSRTTNTRNIRADPRWLSRVSSISPRPYVIRHDILLADFWKSSREHRSPNNLPGASACHQETTIVWAILIELHARNLIYRLQVSCECSNGFGFTVDLSSARYIVGWIVWTVR